MKLSWTEFELKVWYNHPHNPRPPPPPPPNMIFSVSLFAFGINGECLCLSAWCRHHWRSRTLLLGLGGVSYTQVTPVVWTWSSENPLQRLRNSTLNTGNFPRVNTAWLHQLWIRLCVQTFSLKWEITGSSVRDVVIISCVTVRADLHSNAWKRVSTRATAVRGIKIIQ